MGMLTHAADARVGETTVAAGSPDELSKVPSLELGHRILPTGEAVADIGGELDIATAGMAVRYVKHVIDSHRGPVIVDLTALGFCDARGLSALLCMAGYAERAGCPFRLTSPSALLIKLMRITGLDRRFMPSPEVLTKSRPMRGGPARSRAELLRSLWQNGNEPS